MSLVERLTGRVVLLPVAVAMPRVRRHDDAGLRAVDSRFPGVACPYEASVLELERVLAQVPDVALLVLRVVVEGPLDGAAALRDRVAHDGAADAEDLLGLTGHDLVVGLGGVPAAAPEMESGAGDERPVRVVHLRHEVGRVDRGSVWLPDRRQSGRGRRRGRGRRGARSSRGPAAARRDGERSDDRELHESTDRVSSGSY
jgi:hypothetical protein